MDKTGFLNRTVPMIIIGVVSIMAFAWLFRMTSVLSSYPESVSLEYRVVIDGEYGDKTNIMLSDTTQREDAYFKVLKDAEEHLRDQMNSWLTILGFFSIVLGLLVPLSSYMLQRRSLLDERERIERELENKINMAVSNARQSVDKISDQIKQLAQDAMTAALSAKEGVRELANKQAGERPIERPVAQKQEVATMGDAAVKESKKEETK